MSDYESKLKLYSLGIVIEAKKRGSMFIKVYPIEELPLANGDIGSSETKSTSSTKNLNGVAKSASINADMAVVAKWLASGEGNRTTAPDVQPSETVILYKFADTDEYFWESRECNASLRRLETVRYKFGNKPSGTDPTDDDSSYWIEFSTHDKSIKLHTSKNDGEPFAYDIKLDTKVGKLTIDDNAGNNIELNSETSVLTINTNLEAVVNTKSAIVNTETTTVNASSSVNVNSPMTKISDDVTIGGSLTVTKGISSGGGGTFGGALQSQGDISTSGNVMAAGTVSGTNI